MMNYSMVSAWTDLLLLFCVHVNSLTFIRVGGLFPLTDLHGNVDKSAAQYLASFLMAIREINNKNDGILDNLLPNTRLVIAVRNSKGKFIETFQAATELTSRVFNNSGIQAAIGPATVEEVDGATPVYNRYDINYVTYASTASYLSYVGPFPYYIRTAFSDAFQGIAMADMIHKTFDWKKVVIFSTADTYGGDGINEFRNSGMKRDIEILGSFQFRPGSHDLDGIIQAAKSLGGRIFILFVHSSDGGRLLEAGYKAGLFHEGTQVIGSSELPSPAVWEAMSPTADVPSIMKGVIAMTPHFGLQSNVGQTFIQRWRSQPSTKQINSGGPVVCDTSTDDTDRKLFIQPNGDCGGLDFKSFPANGTGIAGYTPFVYDATYLLAHALHYLIYVQNNTNWSAADLANAFTRNETTPGVTGDMNTLTGDPDTGYRYGDREAGVTFNVVNYRYDSSSKISGFQKVGVWDEKKHFVACQEEVCGMVYNTVDNSVPLDMPPAIYVRMDVAMKAVLYTMSALCFLMVLCFMNMLVMYRKNRLIRASQPLMMLLILFGGLLACAKIALGGVDVSDDTCVLGTWFGHLSFVSVFSTLVVKTWRVHLVVNSALKRVKITASFMFKAVAACLLFFVMYLSLYAFVGQIESIQVTTIDSMQQRFITFKCRTKLAVFGTALYAVEGLILMMGIRLCWLTKDIPDAINESKFIGLATYVIAFVSLMVFPIVFLLPLSPEYLQLIVGMGFAVATFSALLALFGPKALLLWQGANLDHNFNLVRNTNTIGAPSSSPNGSESRSTTYSQGIIVKGLAKRLGAASSSAATGANTLVIAANKFRSGRFRKSSIDDNVGPSRSVCSIGEHEVLDPAKMRTGSLKRTLSSKIQNIRVLDTDNSSVDAGMMMMTTSQQTPKGTLKSAKSGRFNLPTNSNNNTDNDNIPNNTSGTRSSIFQNTGSGKYVASRSGKYIATNSPLTNQRLTSTAGSPLRGGNQVKTGDLVYDYEEKSV